MGLIPILAVMAAAAAIVAQGRLNGELQQGIGLINTVFWVHFSVALLLAPVILGRHQLVPILSGFISRGGNPWTLAGGLLGIVIVGGLSYAIPIIGIKKAFFLLIAAQLVAAIAMNSGFDFRRWGVIDLLAVCLILAAAYLSVFRAVR